MRNYCIILGLEQTQFIEKGRGTLPSIPHSWSCLLLFLFLAIYIYIAIWNRSHDNSLVSFFKKKNVMAYCAVFCKELNCTEKGIKDPALVQGINLKSSYLPSPL